VKYYLQILLIFILFSCNSTLKNRKTFYLTTLNNYGFIINKNDSIQINKLKIENKKFSDSCNKYKLNCLLDGGYESTEFKGGINNFRKIIFENFKIPSNTPESVNNIYIVIAKNNKIKSYNIKSKDKKVENELNRILSLPEINNWNPGSFNHYKLESYIELDLIIEKK